MKRFMKVCAVAALIMIVLGAVLGIVGSSAVGRDAISSVVDKVTGGRIKVFGGSGWGLLPEIQIGGADMAGFNIGDSSMFSRDYEVLAGDVEKYCPGSGIRNLKVEVGGCHFETKKSEDGSVYLEAEKTRKFQGYVEGDTLYVMATAGAGISWLKDARVVLYLPEEYEFGEVEVDMGAGEMKFDRLEAEEASLEVGAGRIVLNEVYARNLEISVGAGQIELKEMTVGHLDAEVGMGEFLAKGVISGSVEAECSMGNIEMEIEGRKEDFNYHLEGSMGNIDLDRESFGGFAEERDIDNHAEKTMQVECSMGNISIRFR